MKKKSLSILIKVGIFLSIVSFVTSWHWVTYATTCQGSFSYLNPFGIEPTPVDSRFSNLCGMMVTKGPIPLHFLITDLTVIHWLGFLLYLVLRKKR